MSSRRDVLIILGALALSSSRVIDFASAKNSAPTNALRVRTITAGVELSAALELDRVERALVFLGRAKESFVAAGYEVQTIRIAINPVITVTIAITMATMGRLMKKFEIIYSLFSCTQTTQRDSLVSNKRFR